MCVTFFQHFYFCNVKGIIIIIWKYHNHHKVGIKNCYFCINPRKSRVEVIYFLDTELRNIIDKLAQFVARNGPEFEQMTKNKQKGNPKFLFLYGGEFYNYYQYKVTTEQASKYLDMIFVPI